MPCKNACGIIDTIYIYKIFIFLISLFYFENAKDWEMATIIYLLQNS